MFSENTGAVLVSFDIVEYPSISRFALVTFLSEISI